MQVKGHVEAKSPAGDRTKWPWTVTSSLWSFPEDDDEVVFKILFPGLVECLKW
jgi:hypothetical protein